MTDDLIETLSEAAHHGWMDAKRGQGITSRTAEWGEEFMVPYSNLSERAKDADRSTVKGVLAAIERAGLEVVDPNEDDDIAWHLDKAMKLLQDDTRPEVCRWREGAFNALAGEPK